MTYKKYKISLKNIISNADINNSLKKKYTDKENNENNNNIKELNKSIKLFNNIKEINISDILHQEKLIINENLLKLYKKNLSCLFLLERKFYFYNTFISWLCSKCLCNKKEIFFYCLSENQKNKEIIQNKNKCLYNINKLINLYNNNQNFSYKTMVMSILGHINHGKTTIIKSLTKNNIQESENITQDLVEYEININNQKIIILDTPGHDIFDMARKHSLLFSDIYCLVISIVDGLEKETIKILNLLYLNKLIDRTFIIFTKSDLIKCNNIKKEKISQLMNNIDLIINASPEYWISSMEDPNGIKNIISNIINIYNNFINIKNTNPTGTASGTIIDMYLFKNNIFYKIFIESGTLTKNMHIISNGWIFKFINAWIPNTKKYTHKIQHNNIIISNMETIQTNHISPIGAFTAIDNTYDISQFQTLYKHALEKIKYNNISKILNTFEIKEQEDKALLNIYIFTSSEYTLQSITNYINNSFKEQILIKDSGVGISKNNILLIDSYSIKKKYIIFFRYYPNKNIIDIIKQKKIEYFYIENVNHLIYFIKNNIQAESKNKFIEIEILKLFYINNSSIVYGSKILKGNINVGESIKKINNTNVLYKIYIKSLKINKVNTTKASLGDTVGIIFSSELPKDIQINVRDKVIIEKNIK